MKIKSLNKSIVFKYFLIGVVCFIFSCSSVGNFNPFLFAFFFAGLYVGLNEKILSVFVLLFSMLKNSTLNNIFITITVVAVGIVVLYIHKLFKKSYFLPTNIITFVLSLVTFVYYNHTNLMYVVLYIILGVVFLFASVVVLQVLFVRNNCLKLTLDESICFMFFLAVIGLGLSGLFVGKFSVFKLVAALVIFLSVAIGQVNLTYCIAISLSLGASLNGFNLLPIAECVVFAMAANLFNMPHKFKIVLSSLVVSLAFQYLFIMQNVDFLLNLIPLVVAGIIFICLPNRMLQNLSNLVYVKKSELSSRGAINTTRKNLRKRMSDLSNVFLEMKQIHLNMVKKETTKEELASLLNKEVMCSCCKDCLDKNRCTRSLGTENKSDIQTLVEIAIAKGKVTLLDIPTSLSNRCAKVNQLITLINRLTSEYRQYKNVMADVNNVKILLADQMGAVSSLLLDISKEIDTNVKFDIVNENKIISKLLNNNIFCKEVLIYNEKNNNITVELVVSDKKCNNSIIEKIASQVLKTPMQINKILPMEESGFNSVTLTSKSRYDCVFGLSCCNKSGEIESGDCHSIIRLNKNKFLLALCDGMGSGRKAHAMSAITLGLIENFYKVGFDNEIIIESVNKLLAVNNQENYSTLDICVIDLEKCVADFIKVGSPFGLIKRDGGVEKIESGTLPIGALDTVNPVVSKSVITMKDIIILATDGITDAFETEENLMDFVCKLATNNPQTIADSILNEALSLNAMQAKDDMSVLVARTYLKN